MFEAKNAFIGALLMLKKFTIFNIKFYAETEEADYAFGIFILPFLGLLIGLFSLPISLFKYLYQPIFIGILIFIYYCIITKSTNIIDTNKTIMSIFKTQSIESQLLGTIATMIICLLYFTLLSISSIRAIILAPMVGFSNLLIMGIIIKRDKKNTSILKYCLKNHAIFAFIFAFVVTIVINYRLTISLSLTYIIAGILMNFIDAKIKILPSSTEGFIIEISQILFLMLSYILFL